MRRVSQTPTSSDARQRRMDLLNFVLVPLLVAMGLLAYRSYQDQLDVEAVVGVVVFLIIAAVVGTIEYRRSRKQRGTWRTSRVRADDHGCGEGPRGGAAGSVLRRPLPPRSPNLTKQLVELLVRDVTHRLRLVHGVGAYQPVLYGQEIRTQPSGSSCTMTQGRAAGPCSMEGRSVRDQTTRRP